MVKILDERLAVSTGVGPSFTYTPQIVRKNDILTGVEPEKSFFAENKNTIAAGLLTTGGVLLYLGLRSPGKSTAFNNFIKGRIFEMEVVANRYRMFANDLMDTSFSKITKYVDAYKKARLLNPSESVVHIRMLNDPEKIVNAQDIAFDAILNMNRSFHRSGTSDIEGFAVKFEKIKQEVTQAIERKQNQTELELEDYLFLPKSKSYFSADDIESGEISLINAKDSLKRHMADYRVNRLANITAVQFDNMHKAIDNSEHMQFLTKEKIINASFDKIRELLGLSDDFVPLYNQNGFYNVNLDEFALLSKPVRLPKRITSKFEPNIYMAAVVKKDFSKLNENELREIFYQISDDNNLKDLKFMIDRFRLREVVAGADKSDDAQIYRKIVMKLEYLYDKLQEFGQSEFVLNSRKDFKNVSVEQRKSQIYSVMSIARRMGYHSIERMDKHFSKTSELYRDLNIREFIKIFKDNPEVYTV